MNVLSKDEFQVQLRRRLVQIKGGNLFIYPTDTIYGIGCDATNSEAVAQIRQLKERPKAPFSVIAPSKAWIQQCCALTTLAEEWVGKLPGPYTLILPLRDPLCIAPGVLGDAKTLGVRMPKHWTAKIAEELNLPIVTTSVNKSGKEFLTNPTQLSADFRDGVAFCIDEGELNGKPSMVINLTGDAIEIVHRK